TGRACESYSINVLSIHASIRGSLDNRASRCTSRSSSFLPNSLFNILIQMPSKAVYGGTIAHAVANDSVVLLSFCDNSFIIFIHDSHMLAPPFLFWEVM